VILLHSLNVAARGWNDCGCGFICEFSHEVSQ
jgi:hypothetical protein